MKSRPQIELEREDYEVLRAWAQGLGVSISGAIHRLIRENLALESAQQRERERFLGASGALSELPGEKAVSEQHDRWLYGVKPR